TTQPQHTTVVTEQITLTDPDPATGLPTKAHIHLPYKGADSGIYARTLRFSWDKYSPPGRHFVVKINDIYVNNAHEEGLLGGSDGEWYLWAEVCGQWIFLTELDPHGHGENDGFLEVGDGDKDTL